MKKVSKRSLSSSFWRWLYDNLTCFSCEHMRVFGYMWSMLPIIQELYETKDKQTEKPQTYYPFFNTELQIGSIVVGITVGLEEARTNGVEEIDDEMINGVRAGLMGPLVGIDNSLIVGTYIPVLLGVTLDFVEGGSIIGPLFCTVAWNVTSIFFQKWIYNKGYELGDSAAEVIVGEQVTTLRESVIVMGQVIVGAMTGTWVSITTSVQPTTSIQSRTEMAIRGSKVTEKATGAQEVPVLLQEKLDGALPGVLTLLFILGCWWLVTKKAVSPIKIMLLVVVVAVVSVLVGSSDPGLSY